MAEDWRVTASLHEGERVRGVLQRLHEDELEDDVRERLGRRVAVSGDAEHVFLYADNEGAAREGERVLRETLGREDLVADLTVDRWHPLEERWEDAGVPLPQTQDARAAEHARLEEEETEESRATGLAEWEVRVELDSHRDAVELAERLEAEGHAVVRRWRFLVVGAANEDEAKELARRLQDEAPAGSTIHVEPGGGAVWQALPANPFAVFGGLGT